MTSTLSQGAAQEEPAEQETPVVEISSRAKRLSARNSDEVPSTRSKRVSARLKRNSSSEAQSRNSSSERSRRDSSPGILTLKERETDSDSKQSKSSQSPKKVSPVKKDSGKKESPNKRDSTPAKSSSPKITDVPKKASPRQTPKNSPKVNPKNSPKNESENKSSHTLIIDDVIEFEMPKKASPLKEKLEFKKEVPTIQMATTPVLKPHKLELTEPEPVPITDTKITKRGHSGCSDQVGKNGQILGVCVNGC